MAVSAILSSGPLRVNEVRLVGDGKALGYWSSSHLQSASTYPISCMVGEWSSLEDGRARLQPQRRQHLRAGPTARVYA